MTTPRAVRPADARPAEGGQGVPSARVPCEPPPMRRSAGTALLLVVLAVAAARTPAARGDGADAVAAKDRARLLQGIEAVERPGAPGAICVFGDDAFAVLTGGDERPEAVVAASRAGAGRVVAFSHNGYVVAERLAAQDGAGTLLVHALRWAAGDDGTCRVGVVGGDGDRFASALVAAGFVADADPKLEGPEAPDVVLLADPDAFGARADALAAYVRRGGGLVAGACPWGWEQVRRRPIRTGLPLNGFLATCGLVFADGIPDATDGNRFAVAKSRPDEVHAGAALRAIEARSGAAASRFHVVEKALRSVPPGDTSFLPRAAKVAAKVPLADLPRPSHPLESADGLARLAVAWRSIAWRDLAPEDVRAAPGADEFPGAPPATAPRVSVQLILDAAVPGWHSTGLYLAPGEMLTITAGAATAAPASAPAWRVRVGCHTDLLWNQETWNRWPEITHTVPVGAGVTRVATPWGGPVYFEPLDGAKRLDVTVAGAVEAPVFDRRHASDPGVWPAHRDAPAPWAELVGEHLAISLPSAAVRDLEDPASLMEWWDSVVAAHCDLGAEALPARPERFVCDTQISAGYMHSGYPIMMHLDVGTPTGGKPAALVDLGRLRREGSWGPFHELGHNRQKPDWTFDGTVEVTCNLFSLHAGDVLCGVAPWTNPWLEGQKAGAAKYLAHPVFARWKSDPGVALTTYALVVREFGWKPFRAVFAESLALPVGERPTGDEQKIDRFVLRLSAACGSDLRPYFRRWAWPLSAAAMRDEATSALPVWAPDLADVRPSAR